MLNDDLETQKAPDEALKGLRSPRVVTLAHGEFIYRFASSQTPRSLVAASPWWIREQDHRRILARVAQGKLSTGFVARSSLAVQQSWGNLMDVLVRAVVLEDIKAFCGSARTQYREQAPNGMFITWRGAANIEQLFIPGVSQPKGAGLTDLGRRAIQLVELQQIDTFQLWEVRT